MKILIVTPLFPPDVSFPAQYAKELARRLSDKHQVTVLLYGNLPEELPNVTFRCVEKRRSVPLRTYTFIRTLIQERNKHDRMLVCNGPTVEMPLSIASLLGIPRFIFIQSDPHARTRSRARTMYNFFFKKITRQSETVLTLPTSGNRRLLERPEIHPLKEYPTEAFQEWEQSWQHHLTEFNVLLQ